MKKILIYNSGGGLGDSIQLIPLITSLQKHFNNTEFFYLSAHPNHFEGKLKDYGIKINTLDLNIKYFEVDHKPVKFAYGFCFTNKNKKLSISGDTRPCENLMKYAQKSDVLLHEVFIEGEILQINKMRTKKNSP